MVQTVVASGSQVRSSALLEKRIAAASKETIIPQSGRGLALPTKRMPAACLRERMGMRPGPACGYALAAACWLYCGRCASELPPSLGLAAFVACACGFTSREMAVSCPSFPIRRNCRIHTSREMAEMAESKCRCVVLAALVVVSASAERVTFFVSPDTHFTQAGGVPDVAKNAQDSLSSRQQVEWRRGEQYSRGGCTGRPCRRRLQHTEAPEYHCGSRLQAV
jgi:hypothetical protein